MLLFSCKQADYNYYFRIINNTPETIYFDFDGTPESAPPGTTELGKAHYTALTDISGGGYPIKIKMNKEYTDNWAYITCTFLYADSYKLDVINTLPLAVTIRAADYIDNSGSAELTVPANGSVSGINIYTRNPNFTIVSPSNPVIIDWNFINDTINVTLR